MYKVIRYFEDAQDNNHAYNVGDVFPHAGMKVSQKRINDLVSGNNFQRVQLIELETKKTSRKEDVKTDAKDESKDENLAKDDILKLPFFKLKSVAKANGIDVSDKKADELKTELIEKLGL